MSSAEVPVVPLTDNVVVPKRTKRALLVGVRYTEFDKTYRQDESLLERNGKPSPNDGR